MAIEYLTGLNAIVMKAIWNIEKRQGRVQYRIWWKK